LLLERITRLGIVASLDEIGGIGRRVVHGGEVFHDSTLITFDVIEKIAELSELAPLHNPANLTGIIAFQEAMPNVLAVAVFDTAFHQTTYISHVRSNHLAFFSKESPLQ
jgi:acetate kinase